MILFGDRTLIEKHPYATARIKSMKTLMAYNLDSGFYGGNAYYIAELQDMPILLIVTKDLKVLDIAVMEEDIPKLPIAYINSLVRSGKYKKQNKREEKEAV